MPANYDFEESIGYWLTLATQALHRRVSQRLAPQGITFRQAQVIGWLVLEGELSQAELVQRLMIEPPTLVRLLDRMEAAGLIHREGDPHDRRRRIVRLTEQSTPVWEQIAKTLRQVRQIAVRDLSADELHELKRLLRLVLANLEEGLPRRRAARTTPSSPSSETLPCGDTF
jgi:MarR family transcriptional regulator for hemolysin